MIEYLISQGGYLMRLFNNKSIQDEELKSDRYKAINSFLETNYLRGKKDKCEK